MWMKSLAVGAVVLFGLMSAGAYSSQASGSQHPVGDPASNAASPEYILAPEDVVTVTVQKYPEYSGDFAVSSDGNISLSGAGRVTAIGKTLAELTDAVIEQLRSNKEVGLLHPTVTCTLKTARMQRVYIIGSVKNSGIFDAKPGWRITEAIAAAGGLMDSTTGIANGGVQPQPSDYKVTVLHPQSVGITIPFMDVLSGAADKDLSVGAGDVITIAPISVATVYVSGEVGKPGVYQISGAKTDLMKAITMAGGFTQSASTAHVTIVHPDGSRVVEDLSHVVQGTQVDLAPLQGGDLVQVPELQEKVAVLGLVKAPGTYNLPDGKVVRLTDAIGLAQGYDTTRARTSRIALMEEVDGKSTRQIIDLGRYLRSGDLTANPIIKAGTVIFVPETNTPNWEHIFAGMSNAVTLAGTHAVGF
jgi:protein involved in polysaccharide export with SLBB domain